MSSDIDPTAGYDCRRLLRLALTKKAAAQSRAGVLAITKGSTFVRVLKGPKGREVLVSEDAPADLASLGSQCGARWALSLSEDSVASLRSQLGEPEPEGPLLPQLLRVYSALRDLAQQGEAELWPWGGGWWPVKASILSRGLDALCADGAVAVVGVFDQGALCTGLAVRRRADGADAIWGRERLQGLIGPESGDWRRDQRFLLEGVSAALGPVDVGCFGEVSTFRGLRGAPPGAWAAALAMGDILISPMPIATVIPIGLDLGRLVLSAVDDILNPEGPAPEALSGLWSSARSKAGAAAPDLILAPLLFVRRLWANGDL